MGKSKLLPHIRGVSFTSTTHSESSIGSTSLSIYSNFEIKRSLISSPSSTGESASGCFNCRCRSLLMRSSACFYQSSYWRYLFWLFRFVMCLGMSKVTLGFGTGQRFISVFSDSVGMVFDSGVRMYRLYADANATCKLFPRQCGNKLQSRASALSCCFSCTLS